VEPDVTHLDILYVVHSHEIINILLEIHVSLKSRIHLDINLAHHISAHLARLSLLTHGPGFSKRDAMDFVERQTRYRALG
jgi:hypothetical protein